MVYLSLRQIIIFKSVRSMYAGDWKTENEQQLKLQIFRKCDEIDVETVLDLKGDVK